MADMITRCPKCGTAFRISDTLLKSAKGVVRCGSCLSVFNARDYLEPRPTLRAAAPTGRAPAMSPAPVRAAQPDTGKAPPVSQPESQEEPAPASSVDKPSAPLFDHHFDDDELGTADWRIKTADSIPRPDDSQDKQGEVEEEEDDEAWALELLKDDSDLNIKFKKVVTTPEAETPAPKTEASAPKEISISRAERYAPVEQPVPPPTPPLEADTQPFEPEPRYSVPREPEPSHFNRPKDEDDLTSPSDEDTIVSFTPIPSRDTPTVSYRAAEADASSGSKNEEEVEDVDEKIAFQATHPAPIQQPVAEPASEAEPTLVKRKPIRPTLEPKSPPLKEVIASLEPEPLEVSWQEPGAWRKRLLWPLLALLALTCLLAQVAWLEFDRLSRIEPYRSFYAVACRYIGCQLPELIDRSQIQTSNLLVRSHPTIADALQVDVILQNSAPFEQSFPSLELTFTNLRSEPVAKRKLTPAEYLGGELAGRDKMPIRQPIHIALEIADPGKEAVSYHITIVD